MFVKVPTDMRYVQFTCRGHVCHHGYRDGGSKGMESSEKWEITAKLGWESSELSVVFWTRAFQQKKKPGEFPVRLQNIIEIGNHRLFADLYLIFFL